MSYFLKLQRELLLANTGNPFENKAIVAMKEQFVEEIECEVRAVFDK